MEMFPWYLQVLLALNFLISAAFGVASLIIGFWFVKLLQATVRALDRWQPTKPAQASAAPRTPLRPEPDESRYQPRH